MSIFTTMYSSQCPFCSTGICGSCRWNKTYITIDEGLSNGIEEIALAVEHFSSIHNQIENVSAISEENAAVADIKKLSKKLREMIKN